MQEFMGFQNNFYILLKTEDPNFARAMSERREMFEDFSEMHNKANAIYEGLELDTTIEEVKVFSKLEPERQEQIVKQLKRFYQAMREAGYSDKTLQM